MGFEGKETVRIENILQTLLKRRNYIWKLNFSEMNLQKVELGYITACHQLQHRMQRLKLKTGFRWLFAALVCQLDQTCSDEKSQNLKIRMKLKIHFDKNEM